MGFDIEVRWNGHNLGPALLKRARPVMAQGIGVGLDRSAQHWRNGVWARFGRVKIGPARADAIGNRSNALRNSLGFRVVSGQDGGLEGLRAVMFSAGVPYARAQQFGAVIRPKRAKRLAIPGPANLTAALDTRKSDVRAWFDEFGRTGEIALVPSRRTPGNTVVLWRPSNRRFEWDDGLVGRKRLKVKRKPAAWQHWWTLTKQVTLPGPKSTGGPSRLGFYETWRAQRADRAALVRHNVQQALNRAKLTAYVSADSVEIV